MTDWRLGTVGFGYSDWAGVFYPKGVRSGDYLSYYAERFNCVELDTTFHATPPPERFRKWASATPRDFRFSLKVPKQVTHEPPLAKAVGELQRFVDHASELEGKLAVLLMQFPPSLNSAADRAMISFLDQIPKLPDGVRYAIEFRHPSWNTPRTLAFLSERQICLVNGDYVGEPDPLRVTTDMLYIRFIGEHDRFEELNHEQIDLSSRLKWWTEQIAPHRESSKSIWTMFNNDYAGYAIASAERFAKLEEIKRPEPPAPVQPSLF